MLHFEIFAYNINNEGVTLQQKNKIPYLDWFIIQKFYLNLHEILKDNSQQTTDNFEFES